MVGTWRITRRTCSLSMSSLKSLLIRLLSPSAHFLEDRQKETLNLKGIHLKTSRRDRQRP